MTSLSVVKKAQEGVAAAIAARDWLAADRGIQTLAGSWLRASQSAEPAQLKKVVEAVRKLRVKVIAQHDVEARVGPEQIAWLLAGVSSVLEQSQRPEALVGHDTEGRILEALFLSNTPMSTGDLAKRVRRSVHTVARKLPLLRTRGLVKSKGAGSEMLNWISEAGRAKWQDLDREEQTGASIFPQTLEKHHRRPVASMGIKDLAEGLGRPDTIANELSHIAKLRV